MDEAVITTEMSKLSSAELYCGWLTTACDGIVVPPVILLFVPTTVKVLAGVRLMVQWAVLWIWISRNHLMALKGDIWADKLTGAADSAMVDDETAAEVSICSASHRGLVWELAGSCIRAADNATTPLLKLLGLRDINCGQRTSDKRWNNQNTNHRGVELKILLKIPFVFGGFIVEFYLITREVAHWRSLWED
jgi:hypothetical protein